MEVKAEGKSKGQKKKLKYTDTLLTCVGADGYQTPSIMYTHNPQFSEKNWDDGMEELLKFFSIDADRIVYTKATASYHPETKDTTTHFMDHNTHLKGAILLTDCGNSWKAEGLSILLDRGAAQHIYLEPTTHGDMSINDHDLHSEAKAMWRKKRRCLNDDASSTLCLMQCLDEVSRDHILGWWDRNFHLDTDTLMYSDVEDRLNEIRGIPENRQNFFSECATVYQELCGEDDEEHQVETVSPVVVPKMRRSARNK